MNLDPKRYIAPLQREIRSYKRELLSLGSEIRSYDDGKYRKPDIRAMEQYAKVIEDSYDVAVNGDAIVPVILAAANIEGALLAIGRISSGMGGLIAKHLAPSVKEIAKAISSENSKAMMMVEKVYIPAVVKEYLYPAAREFFERRMRDSEIVEGLRRLVFEYFLGVEGLAKSMIRDPIPKLESAIEIARILIKKTKYKKYLRPGGKMDWRHFDLAIHSPFLQAFFG